EIETADAMPNDELTEIIRDREIKCPACESSFRDAEARDFNLMFETNIGPESGRRGYLRPETAQGIFTNFHRLKRYYREDLPFGVSQVGRAYRNEIHPRQGIIRLREFNQAEVEYFRRPGEEMESRFEEVADTEVNLYPANEQLTDDGEMFRTTLREAVEDEIVTDRTIAYFIGKSQEWYESIGIDPDRLRFRQHLSDERAHYASDCWDGETLTERFGWIEVNGVADRSTYDLTKHADHSGEEMGVFEEYDEPVTREETVVEPDMSALGPRFKDKAEDVVDTLRRLAKKNPEAFEEETVEVEIDGEVHEIDSDVAGFEVREVEERGQNVLPEVIEPSYGIERIVYSVIEHSYDKDIVDDEERSVLRLPSNVAPITVGIFPLMTKDGLEEKAREVERDLRNSGLQVKYDDSGAIGRRYRRHDEIGTPFTVTVDYETLEDGTVTVRDRDTTEQKRVNTDELGDVLYRLRQGETKFDDI
ncbi:MAG: glycine--tRNA ligase, partial [Halobacteria archaeon]|nr:glycine--tRNA ligase [Halobacteria archaeon]